MMGSLWAVMVDFKGRVEGAFSIFADTYDNTWEKPMTLFTNMLIRDIQVPENPMVLDIGCGTGITTFALAKKLQGSGKVYGIDISQKMIDLAKAKAVSLGINNVEFRKGDAEQLDFPVSSFDAIVSNQTFLFLPNKQKALNEMNRVLKPMGQTALLFFAGQTLSETGDIYNRVKERHPDYALPDYGKLINLEETHELFDKAGFKKTRIYGMHQIDYIDPSNYFFGVDAPTTFWRINMPPDFSSEIIEIVKKEIKEEMIKAKTDKGFKSTMYNIIAYAQKT
jgi:ubiquinone/menaquinone biosynthesis C-methylase UbiE